MHVVVSVLEMTAFDVLVVGAGGLMAAWAAAKRGRSVLIADHARKRGE